MVKEQAKKEMDQVIQTIADNILNAAKNNQ